jgi:hypothetical protein
MEIDVLSVISKLTVILKNKIFLTSTLIFLSIVLIKLILSVINNNGVFVYTLDDPYIHLKMAQNILEGHYGINMLEPSAPSSSILWPFFLTLLYAVKETVLWPLMVNIIFTILILFYIYKILLLSYDSTKVKTSFFHLILLALSIPSFNLSGLIFTGMEHSLQLLFIAIIVYGILQYETKKKYTQMFIFSLIVAPLVRYENFAVTLPVLFYLFWNGERKQATGAFFISTITIILFSSFLYMNDLGLLPTSILVKSSFNNQSGIWGTLGDRLLNVKRNILSWHGGLFLLMVLPIILYFKTKLTNRIFYMMITSIILHYFAGRFGWYYRYEIYLQLFIIMSLIYYVFQQEITTPLKYRKKLLISVFICMSFLNGAPLVNDIYAARNVYDHHYFMHKFAQEYYTENIAVSDLGYISYDNEKYILDFGGLASKYVFDKNKTSENNEWLTGLAKKYDVKLAILHRKAFPELPKGWKEIAVLKLSAKKISVYDDEISFISLDESEEARIRSALERFNKVEELSQRLYIK